MKRIVVLISCVLLGTQLIAEHTCQLGTGYSWAECDSCRQERNQDRNTASLIAGFDPEYVNQCSGRLGCNDDTSEFVNPV